VYLLLILNDSCVILLPVRIQFKFCYVFSTVFVSMHIMKRDCLASTMNVCLLDLKLEITDDKFHYAICLMSDDNAHSSAPV